MSEQYYFLFPVVIISIIQIYLMVRYLSKKMTSKFVENLVTYVVILGFLIYAHIKLSIPNFIVTCSVITVIGHTFIGLYLKLYYKSKYYDRYLHLFGSFSFSLLAFSIINNIAPLHNESWIYPSLLVTTLGISIGVIFEILEFIHDSFSNGIKSQHGLADTDFDLIFNVLGSIVAGIISTNIFH